MQILKCFEVDWNFSLQIISIFNVEWSKLKTELLYFTYFMASNDCKKNTKMQTKAVKRF